jgi:hypothetical protein
MSTENKKIDFDKKEVLEVMDFNKVDTVIVTSTGHVYLKKAESYCKAECVRTGAQYVEVNRSELNGKASADKPKFDLSKMNLDQLNAFATENGITVTKTIKKDIVSEINDELAKRTESTDAGTGAGSDEGSGSDAGSGSEEGAE